LAKLQPTELRALREEAAKRFGLLTPEKAPQARQDDRQAVFMAALHDKQLAFALDPAKRKTARCGRRAGKTTALEFMYMKAAREYPGMTLPYICISRAQGKRNFWRPLKTLDAKYGLGWQFNETSLEATTPNGSIIWVCGAADEDDMEKFRGTAYPLVAIDESSSFKPHLQAMVEDAVEPALEDYNGTLAMVGSPGRIPAGMFFDATTGVKKGWSNHHWTVLDNPMFPRWAGAPDWQTQALAWLLDYRTRRGWSEDHPTFRREILGEWVEDGDSTVYKYGESRNTFHELPNVREWYYILGLDFGFDPDPTAFSVGAFSPTAKEYFVMETFAATHMLADDVAAKIRAYEDQYGAFMCKVGDSSGKQFWTELNQRKGTSIRSADRKQKPDFIEMMNNDFYAGRVKVKAGDPLVDEYKRLVWNDDRTKEHPGRPNHRADATLYAWRESRHWAGVQEGPPLPAEGTPEAANLHMQRYLEQAEKDAIAEMNGDNDYWGKVFDSEYQ